MGTLKVGREQIGAMRKQVPWKMLALLGLCLCLVGALTIVVRIVVLPSFRWNQKVIQESKSRGENVALALSQYCSDKGGFRIDWPCCVQII